MYMHGGRSLQIRVFGAIEAFDIDEFSLGGPTQRRILAALSLHRNAVVSVDYLADLNWPDGELPDRYEHNIRTYVHRLRSAFGRSGSRIETIGAGYRLTLHRDELDVERFDRLASSIAHTTGFSDPLEILEAIAEAETLSLGRPYGEFADEDWLRPEVERLERTQLELHERRAEVLLELDRPSEALEVLEQLISRAPLRERPQILLIHAFAGAGRKAEALRVFPRFRQFLIEEAGIEPTDELRELDRALASGNFDRLGARSRSLHGYDLVEQLATNGQGNTYRAIQRALDREVALKAITAEPANQPEFIRRFEADAQRIAQIEHPHVVPLYDYWREPGQACLVSRWMAGGSLADRMLDGPVELSTVERVARQIADALSAVHGAGVVHGNVQPESVFFDMDGRAYLGEFAIALDAADRSVEDGQVDDLAAFEALLGEVLRGSSLEYATAVGPTQASALDDVLVASADTGGRSRFRSVDEVAAALLRVLDGDEPTEVASADPTIANPYKGLGVFDETDSDQFYGRSRLVDELLESVGDPNFPFVALVGPSGSGKSSAVRAGLIPAIRAGRLPGSSAWYVSTLVPGRHPFEALEAALLRVATSPTGSLLQQIRSDRNGLNRAIARVLPESGSSLFLLIDQFEEVFAAGDADEQDLFLAALTQAVTEPGSPLKLVVTLRADFYDQALRVPSFAAILKRTTVVITPLAADELEQAIVGPAARANVEVEPGLVAAIVSEAANQPGSLPLVQYALTELFERRTSDRLILDDYRELGGIAAAVAATAENVFRGLPPQVGDRVSDVFGRLVTIEEGFPSTRRRVLRSEFGADEASAEVLNRYGKARLLSFDHHPLTREPMVELAHETLLVHWDRIRSLIAERRDDLSQQRHLTESAASWVSGGRQPGDLYRGRRLEAVEEWYVSTDPILNEEEAVFLDASRDEEAKRVLQERRRLRRLQLSLASALGLLIVAVLAGVLAAVQGSRARDQSVAAERAKAVAEVRRLTADAPNVVRADREVGLLLAAEAHRRAPGPETLGALQRVLVGAGSFLGLLGAGEQYRAAVWALDGTTVYAGKADGVDLLDVSSGQVETLYSGSAGASMTLSPSGDLLAVSTESSGVALLDTRTGARTVVVSSDAPILAVEFDPTGRTLATGDRGGWLRLWDVASGEEIGSGTRAHPETSNEDLPLGVRFPEGARHESTSLPFGVESLRFTPDGTRIVTAGGVFLRTFSVPDLERDLDIALDRPEVTDTASRFPGRPGDIEIVEDGSAAFVAVGQIVQLIDLESGARLEEFYPAPEPGSLPDDFDLALTKDHLISVIYDGDIRLHDRDSRGAVDRILDSELGSIFGFGQDIAVSADESRLAVAADGGVVILAIDGSSLISRTLPEPAWGNRAQVTPDGSTVMWSSLVRPPVLLDLRRPDAPPIEFPIPDAYTGYLDQYGPMVVWQAVSGALSLGHYIDPETNQPNGRTIGPTTALGGSVSPDGKFLAISRGLPEESTSYVIEIESGTQVSPELTPTDPSDDGVDQMAWSPDQSLLVVTTDLSGAVAYNTDTWEQFGQRIAQGAPLVTVSFTPDGRHLLTVDAAGRLIVRDAATLQPVGIEIAVGTSGSGAEGGAPLAFTEDGRYLISTVDEPIIIDLETWTIIGDSLPSKSGVWLSPSSNGKYVPTVADGLIRVWTVQPDKWPAIACRAAGRNLTENEWKQFGPNGEPRVKTCEQWDL